MTNLCFYIGGKLRTNGKFGYLDNGKFRIGLRHVPMTRGSRERFFAKLTNKFGLLVR